MIPSHVSLPIWQLEAMLFAQPLELGNSPCCDVPFEPRYRDCGCVDAGCPRCFDDTYPVSECRQHHYAGNYG